MRSGRIWAGLAATGVLAAACAVESGEEASSNEQQVSTAQAGLAAVVTIEGGCAAVKVGPRHYLLAARCVTNRPAFAMGKPIRFHRGVAALNSDVVAPDAGADASPRRVDASAGDANASEDAGGDAAAPDAGERDAAATRSDAGPAGDVVDDTIADVRVHPTYLARCGNGACAMGKPGGAEVADLALLVLRGENDIPVVPVEKDAVGAGSSVLLLSNGCDPASPPHLRARPTKLVAEEALAHAGSPYAGALARAAAGSYVVTPGPARTEPGPGICERDMGAPLLLGDGSAVVGVNANVTASAADAGAMGAASSLPETGLHARVDAVSRHTVGAWLEAGGATVAKKCTEAIGCRPGQPFVASGTDASAPDASRRPNDEDPLRNEATEAPEEKPASNTEDEVPRLKRKASEPGCNAAPGGGESSSFGLLLGSVLALTLARRQRRR